MCGQCLALAAKHCSCGLWLMGRREEAGGLGVYNRVTEFLGKGQNIASKLRPEGRASGLWSSVGV
jgi:hypothetical protein